MAKHKTARVLFLRALEHEPKTSEQLADELGMHRRYINRVLAHLRDPEANEHGREIYIEDWYEFTRARSGTFYMPMWRKGDEKDKRAPLTSHEKRNAKYRARIRKAKATAELERAARAFAFASAPVKPAPVLRPRYASARTLILRMLEGGQGYNAARIAEALGYTVQHTTRILRYLNKTDNPHGGREVYIERWRNFSLPELGGEWSAIWKAGAEENAPHPYKVKK